MNRLEDERAAEPAAARLEAESRLLFAFEVVDAKAARDKAQAAYFDALEKKAAGWKLEYLREEYKAATEFARLIGEDWRRRWPDLRAVDVIPADLGSSLGMVVAS